MGLTDKQKQFILDSHNKERANHCSRPLIWDTELEKMADYWANNCQFQHWSLDNKPRMNGQQIGENMQADFSGGSAVTSGMRDFIKEKNYWKCGDNSWSQSTGHYTQMIWPSTTKVGCALANCTNGLGQFLVCEYSPIAWTNEGINTSNCFKNCQFPSKPIQKQVSQPIQPPKKPIELPKKPIVVKPAEKVIYTSKSTIVLPPQKPTNGKIVIIIIILLLLILISLTGFGVYTYLKRKKQ